jgi:protein-tyrosine phosphatase
VRLLSQEPKANPLRDDLVLSRRLLVHELPENIASVVDLTYEFTKPKDSWQFQAYTCYPMLDGSSATPDEIRELATEIIGMPKPVLIHCAQGHGRTGLVASAVLLVSGKAQTAADAIAMVQSVRPGIELNKVQRSVLEQINDPQRHHRMHLGNRGW